MLAVQFASFVAEYAETVIKTGGNEKNIARKFNIHVEILFYERDLLSNAVQVTLKGLDTFDNKFGSPFFTGTCLS